MKTFTSAVGPSEAPRIDFRSPDDSEDSSAGEEMPPLEDSTEGEDPSDPSSCSSSEEEAPQLGPEPYDPYQEDQGQWPDTEEPEEQKMPVVVAPRRGGGRGSSKRSRGR